MTLRLSFVTNTHGLTDGVGIFDMWNERCIMPKLPTHVYYDSREFQYSSVLRPLVAQNMLSTR